MIFKSYIDWGYTGRIFKACFFNWENSGKDGKMKFKFILFVFFLMQIPAAEAYPWMFFRQDKSPGILELGAHASYFVKGQATVFSEVAVEYHNPTIDINAGYTYSFLEKEHYFRLSELALVFPFISEEWTMILGFKDVLWSEADRYWNYGLWQARYMLDAFRPVQMGFPGLYLNYKGYTSFLFLVSYFYLPDIIIYPELKKGKITSYNPFFIESFSEFQWNIDKLELFQINRFFKPTVAFQVKHSLKNSNFSFSYAYKPVNQFQYSVHQPGINLSDDSKGNFTIDGFRYSIVSHHLANLEGEVILDESLSLLASVFYERPEKEKYEEDWTSDGFEPHLTFSFLSYFEENLGEKSKTLFTLGYTKTIEIRSKKRISNTITEDLEQAFGRDFNWKEALSASVEYQDKSLFQGLLFRFRANYALDNGFYALALENYFNFTPHIQIYLSGDVIFHSSANRLTKSSSSISKYKDLSRLLVGGKYVF